RSALRDDRWRTWRQHRDALALRLPDLLPLSRLQLWRCHRGAERCARAGLADPGPLARASRGDEMSRERSVSGSPIRAPAWYGPTLAAVGIALIVGWSLAPALWQVLTALKPDAQITRVPTVYLPHPMTLDHVVALWTRKPFGRYLVNSAWISGWATLLCVG